MKNKSYRELIISYNIWLQAQIYGLAISFKELLETVSKIYCQGRRTTKKQAVRLELGPLCSISEFPLPTQPPPPVGVIRGAFTGAVQSYLTFSIKLLTFSGLTCAITYILAKRCSEMQNLFEFARTTENLNPRGALKLCRFSSYNPGQNLLRQMAKMPIFSCHPGKN